MIACLYLLFCSSWLEEGDDTGAYPLGYFGVHHGGSVWLMRGMKMIGQFLFSILQQRMLGVRKPTTDFVEKTVSSKNFSPVSTTNHDTSVTWFA
ncbi:hypothetical protein EDB86DRAFT_1909288 [Lactarius hatsudake]|nr:hypothetical protein EDB86DRAFT_1909288 [Lactarius hatsudake]